MNNRQNKLILTSFLLATTVSTGINNATADNNQNNGGETLASCKWFASKTPKAVYKWNHYIPEQGKQRIIRQCAEFGITIPKNM